MPALHRKADVTASRRHVRFVPQADISITSSARAHDLKRTRGLRSPAEGYRVDGAGSVVAAV